MILETLFHLPFIFLFAKGMAARPYSPDFYITQEKLLGLGFITVSGSDVFSFPDSSYDVYLYASGKIGWRIRNRITGYNHFLNLQDILEDPNLPNQERDLILFNLDILIPISITVDGY